MGRFVARRLIQSAVLLFVVMTASFFLIHAAPGGPETALFSDPRVNPEALNRMRERFGLNDPLPGAIREMAAEHARARLRSIVFLPATGRERYR